MPQTPVSQPKPSAFVEIERLGFGYSEVAQYDLELIDQKRRIQIRESDHYAPRDEVEKYSVQMGYSQFPPIVMTSDGWILDGNTRAEASLKRGNKFFPAIIVDVAWEKASQKQQNELRILGATFNSQNGRALTKVEARKMAAAALDEGWKPEQIGRVLGMKPAVVTQVKKEVAAAEKLERVGLDANGSVKGASLRALGAQVVLDLNDDPYRALARLAADAGLNAAEIVSTAKDAKATGSDDGALRFIDGARGEMSDRIRQKELTGTAAPPVARQLRQHLGFVVKFAGHETELKETTESMIAQHVAVIEDALVVLQAVLAAQKQATLA